MTLNEILTVLAIFIGPVVAVQLTRHLDDRNEVRQRKLKIFKTLMASRASLLSPQHVEALNLIDLEFEHSVTAEKRVIDAWKAYQDLLSEPSMSPEQWNLRRVDLLVDLLHEMASVLGFEFDKVAIKNSSYYPRLYGEMEQDIHTIRRSFKELLEGKRVIPMYVTNLPFPQPPSGAAPVPAEHSPQDTSAGSKRFA